MAKVCLFDDNRLGLFEQGSVVDVTPALEVLPRVCWPFPSADLLVEHLPQVVDAARKLLPTAPRLSPCAVRLRSPVANPPKVIGAPVNYLHHQREAIADGGINFEKDVKTIAHYGLFLKSSTSVVGPSAGIEIRFPERRTDHELELVVVIGRGGRDIDANAALDHVAGYAIGLDMTVRGPEDRSLRKSLDSFSVVGPWLVTPDEFRHPNNVGLVLQVNGAIRQSASTSDLIFDVEHLIEYASAHYTLCPGDLIFTGTPEGVGPVKPGDVLHCSIEGIGAMDVRVHQPPAGT
ncbi:MAG TPA: fumarylacetoacetate hydrolase family protein [Steroidobacteraceae bacterium]|nr:fumarylacetoacetate hydrolase family protein [Steroidobacteraceae bacterium]